MTGRGVRVAVIDSGIYSAHPHVNGVAGGVGFDAGGCMHADFVDRLGHGTAVAAAIRDQAAEVDLFAVRVFDRQLSTHISILVRAIEWAAQAGMHIANLSLGSPRREHEAALSAAVAVASEYQMLVVAASDDEGIEYFPGSSPGVVPVQVDWALPRSEFRIVEVGGRAVVRTSGLPRAIPGVPPSRNLHGVSFAVANATGIIARTLEGAGADRTVTAVIDRLRPLASARGDGANARR